MFTATMICVLTRSEKRPKRFPLLACVPDGQLQILWRGGTTEKDCSFHHSQTHIIEIIAVRFKLGIYVTYCECRVFYAHHKSRH